MKLKKNKRFWRREYEKRKLYETSEVVCVSNHGEYIAIHFFADELIAQGADAEELEGSYKVDAYWRKGGGVAFLQVVSVKDTPKKEIGYFAMWDSVGQPGLLVLTAVIANDWVYRRDFENAIADLDRLGVFRPRVQKRIGGDKMTNLNDLLQAIP